MRIKIKKEQAELLGYPVMKQFGLDQYQMDDKFNVINLGDFNLSKVETFLKILEGQTEKKKFGHMKSVVYQYVNIMKGEIKGAKMKNLEMFKVALIKKFMDFDGHRIYTKDQNDSDIFLCYRITRIIYEPPSAYQQAHTKIKLIFKQFDRVNETSETFHSDEVVGKTVDEILIKNEMFIETKEIRNAYLDSIKKFDKIKPKIGTQYLVTGMGTDNTIDDKDDDDEEEYTRHYSQTKYFDFEETKSVLDVFKEGDQSTRQYGREQEVDIGETFWANPLKTVDEFEDEATEDIEENIEIPIHPFVVIFDLQRHLRLVTHYSYLKEYVYDENLSEKLVLPENTKQLIQSLIEHKTGGFADIIQGKTGGVIIMLSGSAGTGKTLTAEVYAESKKKALYNVQASQLGIKPRLLEHRLMKVLNRATRWDAILLIDEADVYVRERANDLVQNAIVGVFLRILEYHATMLFMTTNRPDTVDDAILSRCIARIDYIYPSNVDQKKIWRILADTAKIELSDEIIAKFVNVHNKYSGRDIKNLLKLGNLKAISDHKKLDYEILNYVTRFNPTLLKVKINDTKVEKDV